MMNANNQRWTSPFWRLLLVGLLAAGLMTPAHAGPREQAQRMHERLAGVPPTDLVLQDMQSLISAGNATAAAGLAMDNVNFYNVTLKNFAAPWTNRDQSVFVPLNDYIATVIGMIRDDIAFNTLLSADLTYVGNNGVVSAPPSANNNDHYAQLEANNINLRDELTATTQSTVQGIPLSPAQTVQCSASPCSIICATTWNRFTIRNCRLTESVRM